MKKKSMLATMAGAAAIGLGMVSAPSTQQVIEQTVQNGNQVTVQQQQANQQRNVRSQQQAQQRTSQNYRANSLTNPYAPTGGGLEYVSSYSMTPKEYGEYLMRTGKDKHNKRCRKHWAKMRS